MVMSMTVSMKVTTETYTVVQLWYPSVRDGQSGLKYEVHKCMDVALLREVQRQRTLFVVPCVLQVIDDVPEERKGCEDANLLSVQDVIRQHDEYRKHATNLLLLRFDTVFLRSDEVEQRLRASVQLVETPILVLSLAVLHVSILTEY